MLDTIKVAVPLTQHQHRKLRSSLCKKESWDWVQRHSKTGDIRFLRHKGSMDSDNNSFHRFIYWNIPDLYIERETSLTLEFSVPKFWYGHNISLLHDWLTPLIYMRKLLQKRLRLRLPKVKEWELLRADLCYAWRCPDQQTASSLLGSLKKLNFPWKKPVIYPDSIMFPGTTYSFKFYLKLPEFIAHDRKELLKSNASLDWVNYLEHKADGVLRCEATLRKKYLRRQKIKSVGDLNDLKCMICFEWDSVSAELGDESNLESSYFDFPGCMEEVVDNITNDGYIAEISLEQVIPSTQIPNFIRSIIAKEIKDTLNTYYIEVINTEEIQKPIEARFKRFIEERQEIFCSEYNLYFNDALVYLVFENIFVSHELVSVVDDILINLLSKVLGEQTGMNNTEEVSSKLYSKYKPAKATRLLGFWLMVKELGEERVKKTVAKTAFYRNKGDLNKAGINFLSEPELELNEFCNSFKFTIPSKHVVNKFDDFRDSDNLLNLIDKAQKESNG